MKFDIDYWLETPSLVAKARRAGVKKEVYLEELPETLHRLVERCVVSTKEARALLDDLIAEGLLDPSVAERPSLHF